jgi:2-methylisocitrate lyase-like PEP mutase family enzyme
VDEATKRCNAYLAAGADCAFPVGVRQATAIATMTKAVRGPLNILAGPGMPNVAELGAIGVRRVSIGALAFRASAALVAAIGAEVLGRGTYELAAAQMPFPDLNPVFQSLAAAGDPANV